MPKKAPVKKAPAKSAKPASPAKTKTPAKAAKKGAPVRKKVAASPTKAKPTPVKKGVKAPVKKKIAAPARKEPQGLPEKLRDAALQVLDERQAENIVTADLRGRSVMADYALAASGRSARQLAAIADYLAQAFAKLGVTRTKVEGLPQGDWVLVDGGDVLVHLFRPEVRRYYDLEAIWSRSPRGNA